MCVCVNLPGDNVIYLCNIFVGDVVCCQCNCGPILIIAFSAVVSMFSVVVDDLH